MNICLNGLINKTRNRSDVYRIKKVNEYTTPTGSHPFHHYYSYKHAIPSGFNLLSHKKIMTMKWSNVYRIEDKKPMMTTKWSNVYRKNRNTSSPTLKGSHVYIYISTNEHSTPTGSHLWTSSLFYKHLIPTGLLNNININSL